LSNFQTLCLFQVIYFQACELVLLSGHQKATYLYTLMFYNVVSYCSSYVKEVYERRNWSPYVTITERSQVKHLGMSATKLTLEWTKLLIFFLTVVFIVLTIAFTQEVQGVKTTLPYIASTFAFYLTTDALFIELFSQWPILSKIEKFECREALYGRLCLKIAASIMAAAIQITLLVYTNRVRLFLFGIYVNVYLRGKQILYNEVATLWQEEEKVKRFPMADKEEIFQFDDVCAICLGGMKNARKTHCKHLFHDHCLSLAVQASPNCPTCKAIL